MSDNWLNISDESILTESNICDFCVADKEECGEYAECCYTNAASVIQDAIQMAYKSEKRDLTFEKVEKLFKWKG